MGILMMYSLILTVAVISNISLGSGLCRKIKYLLIGLKMRKLSVAIINSGDRMSRDRMSHAHSFTI